jgi:hypothetical protein
MPTQPFQRERLYWYIDRHRMRFLSIGNYGVPLFDRIVSDISIEEGHSSTSIDRIGHQFPPSQASSSVRVERAGNAHPTALATYVIIRWSFELLRRVHYRLNPVY